MLIQIKPKFPELQPFPTIPEPSGFDWIDRGEKLPILGEQEYIRNILDFFENTRYKLGLENFFGGKGEFFSIKGIERQHTSSGDVLYFLINGGGGYKIQFTPALIFEKRISLRTPTSEVFTSHPIYDAYDDQTKFRRMWNGNLLLLCNPTACQPGDIYEEYPEKKYHIIQGRLSSRTILLQDTSDSDIIKFKQVDLDYLPNRPPNIYRPFYHKFKY